MKKIILIISVLVLMGIVQNVYADAQCGEVTVLNFEYSNSPTETIKWTKMSESWDFNYEQLRFSRNESENTLTILGAVEHNDIANHEPALPLSFSLVFPLDIANHIGQTVTDTDRAAHFLTSPYTPHWDDLVAYAQIVNSTQINGLLQLTHSPEPATIISSLLGLAGFALKKFRG